MKSFTNSINPFSNLLRRACWGILKAAHDSKKIARKGAATLKIFPKAGHDMYNGENRPVSEKECSNRNSDEFPEQSVELVSVFREASINIIHFFSLTRQSEKNGKI
jgi:hypothetical protein